MSLQDGRPVKTPDAVAKDAPAPRPRKFPCRAFVQSPAPESACCVWLVSSDSPVILSQCLHPVTRNVPTTRSFPLSLPRGPGWIVGKTRLGKTRATSERVGWRFDGGGLTEVWWRFDGGLMLGITCTYHRLSLTSLAILPSQSQSSLGTWFCNKRWSTTKVLVLCLHTLYAGIWTKQKLVFIDDD